MKHPHSPAMTLGNMSELGVERLIAFCLNDACRHQALIDVSSYPADTEVPYFSDKVVCGKCGGRRNKIDVRPNWNDSRRGQPCCGMTDVSEHKFKIGQAVEYYPPRGLFAPRGAYIVTATLPPNRFGEFEYRVKHLAEQHERAAMERNLNAL